MSDTLARGSAARSGGLVAGSVLAWALGMSAVWLGLGLLYGVSAFSACAVAGVLVSDALRHRVSGTVRTAGLRPRRIRDYLPHRLAALLGAQLVVLVALLAGAAATGSADDPGRAGRAFTAVCEGVTSSRGPWPGSYYAVPMLIVLAAGTGLCGWALRRITVGASDDQARRARSREIAAAWGLLVTAPLTGVALTVSSCPRGTACLGAGPHLLGWALLPVTALAAVSAMWCLFTVVFRP